MKLAVAHRCQQGWDGCGTFVCPDCHRTMPACWGGSISPECDDCWHARELRRSIARQQYLDRLLWRKRMIRFVVLAIGCVFLWLLWR